MFANGDAAIPGDTDMMAKFLGQLKQVMKAEIPFTLILDDPMANSYIQNLYAPDVDPGLETEEYERTFEQAEELGLNDIQVEDYGHVEVDEVKHAAEQAALAQKRKAEEYLTPETQS